MHETNAEVTTTSTDTKSEPTQQKKDDESCINCGLREGKLHEETSVALQADLNDVTLVRYTTIMFWL